MRRSAAGAVLITAVGFSAPATVPASAAPLPFPDCSAAAAVGVYDIPAGTPGYGTHLDRDLDGVGCENGTYGYDAAVVERIVAESQQLEGLPPNTGIVRGPESLQMEQMPVGGAGTGVAMEPASGDGATVVAGGLALAAAGGASLLRRRIRSN